MKGDDFRDPVFDVVAVEIGRVMLAWNDLHIAFGDAFWLLTRIGNGLVPLAIWHAVENDRAQRRALKTFLGSRALGYEMTESRRGALKWALDEADNLENCRDLLAHSPMRLVEGKVVIGAHHFGHKKAGKLADKDVAEFCRATYDSMTMLRDYVLALNEAMKVEHSPLPDTPVLPISRRRK